MAARYTYLIVDPTTGLAVAEVPLQGVNFTYGLNAVGQLSAAFPADAPWATEDIFLNGTNTGFREITVLRSDDLTDIEAAVWNGPITNLDGSRRGGWSLTAREASWYLGKRTIEDDQIFTTEDIFQIVRDLVTYMTGKTSNGTDGLTLGDNLNAALPRFNVTAGSAGVTKSYAFSGSAGHLISEALEDALVADLTTGLDWRMDYRTGSTRQDCQRTLTLGSPSLGVTQTLQLRRHHLYDYGRTLDWERAGNRVTGLGNGTHVILQNTGSTAAGDLLLEVVTDVQDLTDVDAITNATKEVRRWAAPPVHDRWVEFTPSVTVPFDLYSPGDVAPFDVDGPGLLQLTAQHRRVLEMGVTPPEGQDPERVRLTMGVPLDETGV